MNLNIKNQNQIKFNRLSAGDNQARGNKRNFMGKNNRKSLPNSNVKSELRDDEEVRKNRQHKATNISRFNTKAAKGKGKGKKNFGNKKKFGNRKK